MQQHLAFSILGPDRPGVVRRLADVVEEKGGNWLESRMIRMGGQFSGVVRVSVLKDQGQALKRGLEGFDEEYVVHAVAEDSQDEQQRREVELSLQGQDKPGIVREVMRALSELEVNVEEMHSQSLSAAMSGENLFHLDAILALPEGLEDAQLREKLETMSAEWMIDLEAIEQ